MSTKIDDPRRITETSLRVALWCGVVALAVVGVVAALGRTVSVGSGGLTYEQVSRLMPAESVREAFAFDRWFASYPVLTLFHVIPGGVFLALAPFQFSSRIRTRYVQLHRWSGRALLLAALPVGLSGLLLAASFPYGGPVAAAAAFVAGAFFLYALARAFLAIRRRDVARHREWMIRMFSVGLGIATIRVLGLAVFAITHVSFAKSAGAVFWAGWLSTAAVAEFWIRRTRPERSALR